MLTDIEFYNSPSGEVLYKSASQPVAILHEGDSIIEEMMTTIEERYPEAFRALSALYSISSINRRYYEYRIVVRFIRCNFGEYDEMDKDINADGHFTFEEVRCPLRGICIHEGIICKPTLNTTLTDREIEVMREIVSNLSPDQIAEKLNISPYTVIRHRSNIQAKLRVHSIAELVAYWHKNNLK